MSIEFVLNWRKLFSTVHYTLQPYREWSTVRLFLPLLLTDLHSVYPVSEGGILDADGCHGSAGIRLWTGCGVGYSTSIAHCRGNHPCHYCLVCVCG